MSELRTSRRIVDAATGLIKVRGYNAFSYQDVSELVGIRKASIHHHFSTKADLGGAVVRQFTAGFGESLDEIDAAHPVALRRIMAFAELAGGLVDRDEMCPCAMLASEAETLPVALREELRAYYARVAGWLAGNVRRGREDGSVRLGGEAEDIAQLVLACVQGAAMTARCMKSRTTFDAAMRQLQNLLAGSGAPD
ncbi:MAG: TetR/AcrR family transcriptional regulator [Alphaproteobacteria bacterium]